MCDKSIISSTSKVVNFSDNFSIFHFFDFPQDPELIIEAESSQPILVAHNKGTLAMARNDSA